MKYKKPLIDASAAIILLLTFLVCCGDTLFSAVVTVVVLGFPLLGECLRPRVLLAHMAVCALAGAVEFTIAFFLILYVNHWTEPVYIGYVLAYLGFVSIGVMSGLILGLIAWIYARTYKYTYTYTWGNNHADVQSTSAPESSAGS